MKFFANLELAETCRNSKFNCTDWFFLLGGSIFSFLFASVLMTGWPEGLFPNLNYPYSIQGDGLLCLWQVQRIAEGGWFSSWRSGFPFNVPFLDFPQSDMGISMAFKMIGLFFNTSAAISNLFFLLGFCMVFASSFVVSRKVCLNSYFALSASLLFSFLPFHFLRLEHLSYTWYFVVALFYFIGLQIYYISKNKSIKTLINKLTIMHLACYILGSFIVYYALFGVIVIAVSGFLGSLKSRSCINIILSISLIVAVSFGVLCNISPHLKHRYERGPNIELAKRSPADSELYALKMTHLLLPRPYHRIPYFAERINKYNNNAPLSTENTTSSLGIIGSVGFVLAFMIMLSCFCGSDIDDRIRFLIGNILILFLFGTIGGLGSLFALIVSPLIRGWSRISVFIAYPTILVFFFMLQFCVENNEEFSKARKRFLYLLLALSLICVGLYDQTTPSNRVNNERTRASFENDRRFIADIERLLPQGSAVYQLPYMPFPETPPLHHLEAYGLLKGFLHSKNLRWSFGGTKARDGDWFFRALSKEPMEKQIEVIKKLGFAGIYIDKSGYPDNGAEIIKTISGIVGEPPLFVQEHGTLVFFKLPFPPSVPDYSQKSSMEIMNIAGFFADEHGKRYESTLSDGVDFTQNGWPVFISRISGLSGYEPWGRWSDANVASSVRFEFFQPLPDRFTLKLEANAFGPNIGKNMTINIGSRTYSTHIPDGHFTAVLDVELGGKSAQMIEFVPPVPTSPKALGLNEDGRRLGIGFIRMRIEDL